MVCESISRINGTFKSSVQVSMIGTGKRTHGKKKKGKKKKKGAAKLLP
jgi:hypothetical protein